MKEEKRTDIIFEEILKDDYYKNKIKEAMVERIVDVVKYQSDEIIRDRIKEIFDDNMKLEFEKQITDMIPKMKEQIISSMMDSLSQITNSIKLKPSSWAFSKFIKDSLEVEFEEKT